MTGPRLTKTEVELLADLAWSHVVSLGDERSQQADYYERYGADDRLSASEIASELATLDHNIGVYEALARKLDARRRS